MIKYNDIKEWLFHMDIRHYEIHGDSISIDQSADFQFNGWMSKPDALKSIKDIQGNLLMNHNKNLGALIGMPKEVKGSFYCHHCNLDSLEGAPEIIEGDFNCSNNNIKDLKGFPKHIKGWVSIGNNAKEFSEKEIREICNVEGVIRTIVQEFY